MVTAASSLVLVARIAGVGAPARSVPLLLGLAGLAALYAGVYWAGARDELDGRRYWIFGMAALSLAAAARAQEEASLALGMALLLSGSMLFLFSARHRLLLPIAVLGLLGFSGLPYTPAWQAMRLYTAPFGVVGCSLPDRPGVFPGGLRWSRFATRPTLDRGGALGVGDLPLGFNPLAVGGVAGCLVGKDRRGAVPGPG